MTVEQLNADESKNAAARQAFIVGLEVAVARCLWQFEGLMRAGVPRGAAKAALQTALRVLLDAALERSDSLEVKCTGL